MSEDYYDLLGNVEEFSERLFEVLDSKIEVTKKINMKSAEDLMIVREKIADLCKDFLELDFTSERRHNV